MRIIILNGAPQSGKGEFARHIDAYQESMIDDVKAIATRDYGWCGTKTPEDRQLLCDIKMRIDAAGRWIIRQVVRRVIDVGDSGEEYCTIDAREPKDIADLVAIFKLLGYPVTTVLIRREVAEAAAVDGCAADTGVLGYEYDYEIRNDGSLKEFKAAIDASGVLG
jgi:chloramphenicol 3-O-phosphotransferase